MTANSVLKVVRSPRFSLSTSKDVLLKMADELLLREVLDAEQVRRIAAGLAIEEARPSAARLPVADEDEARPRQKERNPIVPALNKPITQE